MKSERRTRNKHRAIPPAVPQEGWLLQRLQDPELAAAYLNAALAEGDQGAFMLALRQVARARRGVSTVARHAGLNRASLTRALSAKGNPELSSLNRILRATGLRLVIASGAPPRKSKVPAAESSSAARIAKAA
jgi:probable addiction module antidote protein